MPSPRFSVAAALLGTLLAVLAAAACGSNRPSGFEEPAPAPPNGPTGPTGDLGASGGTPKDPTGIGSLIGTVLAPEGTVPISNALVYLSATPPPVQAPGVFCDKCVELPAGTSYAYSKADGTFKLQVYATGPQYLVTQKGHFRRVRPITTATGEVAVPGALTTLPGAPDPSKGDEIPRIGVTFGGFDKIELSLKKLGITSFDRYGKAPFNDPKGLPPSVGQPMDLLNAPDKLAQYHIVLLPCALGGLSCGAPTGAQKDNLRNFVSAGGKLYVTDYSYEYVNQTWPGFITWKEKNGNDMTANSAWGAACQDGAYTKTGTANDPGLSSWLGAIGEKNFELDDHLEGQPAARQGPRWQGRHHHAEGVDDVERHGPLDRELRQPVRPRALQHVPRRGWRGRCAPGAGEGAPLHPPRSGRVHRRATLAALTPDSHGAPVSGAPCRSRFGDLRCTSSSPPQSSSATRSRSTRRPARATSATGAARPISRR